MLACLYLYHMHGNPLWLTLFWRSGLALAATSVSAISVYPFSLDQISAEFPSCQHQKTQTKTHTHTIYMYIYIYIYIYMNYIYICIHIYRNIYIFDLYSIWYLNTQVCLHAHHINMWRCAQMHIYVTWILDCSSLCPHMCTVYINK